MTGGSSSSPTEEWLRRRFQVRGRLAAHTLCEFAGTFVLMFVGACIGAQTTLSEGRQGSYLQMALAWGLLVAVVLYPTVHISGRR
jgi:glycerol uptake facilitator-like aquaporin